MTDNQILQQVLDGINALGKKQDEIRAELNELKKDVAGIKDNFTLYRHSINDLNLTTMQSRLILMDRKITDATTLVSLAVESVTDEEKKASNSERIKALLNIMQD